MNDKNDVSYLSRLDIVRITKLSKSTLYRLECNGNFPKRRRLSARLVGWLSTEVYSWIASRKFADDIKSKPVCLTKEESKMVVAKKAVKKVVAKKVVKKAVKKIVKKAE